MKKTLLILGLLLSIFTATTSAKNGYSVDVSAPQYANKSIYLAGYFNGKIYAFDTLALDPKGKGTFKNKKTLDEGMYLVYISPSRYFEFLLGSDQNLKVKIDTVKGLDGFEISGSPETEAFAAFGKYMTEKRKEQEGLKKQIDDLKGDSIKIKPINQKIKDLDDEVVAYQKKLITEHWGKILGIFVKALQIPQFPENLANGDMKNKDFLMARYQYAKKHYWDNFDLTDKRIWRINMMNQKLDDYTQHMLIQVPDSIIPDVVNLIEESKKDSICYNLMTNYMINYSVTSKVMGMDKLFVELANRYYFTGKAPWADSTIMKNITSEVKKVRYNLIGMKAANLPLVKYEGGNFNVFDINSKFTLLFFFEPTCGHCKEATPKIHDVYEKFKDKGFQVIAVYLMQDKKEWKEFIEANKINDWINAWDPNRESYYWQFYDTSTTPGVYLLDKDHKIVAKKIDATSLEKILDFELNGKPMTDEK
jgi:thiol-disulfide isomerase/thioredoxin